jgi:hypothetical protein
MTTPSFLLALSLCSIGSYTLNAAESSSTAPQPTTTEVSDSQADNSADAQKDEGYVSIFNGTDLSGWTYLKTPHYDDDIGYVVKDEQLVAHGRCGNLYTNKRYRDYKFKFEFRFEPGKFANSGLGMRSEMDGKYPAYVHYEIQILDDPAYMARKNPLKDWQYHGSIYGKVAAKTGSLKPVGEWNTQIVTVIGNQVTIDLNGTIILDSDISNLSQNARREEGHLCIAGHMDGISFRNLQVKEITPANQQATPEDIEKALETNKKEAEEKQSKKR